MIIHIQHHKEERDFSVRPVTGNYVDCHIYITINRFKLSQYSGEDARKDYPFHIEYTGDKKSLMNSVNEQCDGKILFYHEESCELRIHKSYFPEVLEEMPSENWLPAFYPTNPTRLVKILKH